MLHPARLYTALALATALLPDAAAAGNDLRVGTCSRDITPVNANRADEYEAAFGTPATINYSRPIFMAGFGNGRIGIDYHDRLWARGIVVESRGGRVAIVALDTVSYFVNEIDTVRAMLAPESGIHYLIVHSTHNHEGPDTIGLWGPTQFGTGIDYGYLDFVNAAIADCVDEAAANLRKARVKFATTTSAGLSTGADAEDDGFGVSDGKVLVGDAALAPATGGRIVDPRLAVMQFTERDGKQKAVIATLVNFASHPESMGSSNQLITSDFPHFARERLEAQYGGLAIWVSADLGVLQGPLDIDVLDPLTGVHAPRRTFRWLEVHGAQLAERVIEALDKKPGHPAPRISFASTAPVAVRLDNPFFRLLAAAEVLSVRRSLYTNGVPDPSEGFTFPEPATNFPTALGEDIHTEVGALRIGEASFAVVPTELDPQIGETYRAAMVGAKHTFIIGLGNDHIGYQVPFAKWDDSCHACAGYVALGAEDSCPIQPVDCNTVFENNAGQMVDPSITDALLPLLDALH